MMRSAVTVSLVEEARGGPFVFWHDLPAACRTARALGFDGVDLYPPSGEAVDVAGLGRLLAEHGLALGAVGTGAGWVRHRLHLVAAEAEVRLRARRFIRKVIDFAAGFGAPAVIGSMQGRSGDPVDRAAALGYLAEALEELGEHAARRGVPLLYEPVNRYESNLVNTLAAGAELLDSLATRNVRLLADLFHMNIEEADPAGALRAAAGRLGHVHLVDSNRRPAGQGHLDFAALAQALKDTGYEGFVSAEALPYPNPEAAARGSIEAFRRWFR